MSRLRDHFPSCIRNDLDDLPLCPDRDAAVVLAGDDEGRDLDRPVSSHVPLESVEEGILRLGQPDQCVDSMAVAVVELLPHRLELVPGEPHEPLAEDLLIHVMRVELEDLRPSAVETERDVLVHLEEPLVAEKNPGDGQCPDPFLEQARELKRHESSPGDPHHVHGVEPGLVQNRFETSGDAGDGVRHVVRRGASLPRVVPQQNVVIRLKAIEEAIPCRRVHRETVEQADRRSVAVTEDLPVQLVAAVRDDSRPVRGQLRHSPSPAHCRETVAAVRVPGLSLRRLQRDHSLR